MKRPRSRIALALALAASIAAFAVAAFSAGACSESGSQVPGSAAASPASAGIHLTSLDVTSAETGKSVLAPPFAAGIHDYYVRCAPGGSSLTISMTAADGYQSALLQPTASSPSPSQTHTLSVVENQAIVAAATDGSASNEYWIRCLPADFPPMRVDLHPQAGAPSPGYYLVGNQEVGGAPGYAIVLDTQGVPVWYHRVVRQIWDVDNLTSGSISYFPSDTINDWEVRQLSPIQTSEVAPSSDATGGHELRHLQNGNYLLFTSTSEYQSGVDLTGFTTELPDGGVATLGPNGTIRPCTILEVDPAGSVVWKWVGTDHFSAGADSTYGKEEPAALRSDGTLAVDPFHCNSIDVDPANGNLLVSARNMDSIFYIDRATGAVLWKMGGAPYSRDGAVYIPVIDPFRRQHDARLRPGWSTACHGSGQISLFDDETATRERARGVLYDVTVGSSDGSSACGAPRASVAWQYPAAQSSYYMGSFRIQDDGARVIGWGDNGQRDLVFSEIDAKGNDVLDFHFTDNSQSYRAPKVPLSTFDLGLLRSATALP